MFGDNKSIVDSSLTPNVKLTKRHNMLSFHWTREAIAFGICVFNHIDGDLNPADILSKHWSYGKIRHLLKPLMFYSGDTIKLWEPQ